MVQAQEKYRNPVFCLLILLEFKAKDKKKLGKNYIDETHNNNQEAFSRERVNENSGQ